MNLVTDIDDIIENIKRADMYLSKDCSEEKEFMLEKISSGKCFVVVKDGEVYKFYPSKFIGYKDNNPRSYKRALDYAVVLSGQIERSSGVQMYDFDGRMSNKVINSILKCRCEKDYGMSEKFNAYCEKLGIKGSDKKKFWKKVIEI